MCRSERLDDVGATPHVRVPDGYAVVHGPHRGYYVTFWTQPEVPRAVGYDKIGWGSEMYEVFAAADVVEVVEWAETSAIAIRIADARAIVRGLNPYSVAS